MLTRLALTGLLLGLLGSTTLACTAQSADDEASEDAIKKPADGETPPWLYEGPMPALEDVKLVTSISGHTLRVTGDEAHHALSVKRLTLNNNWAVEISWHNRATPPSLDGRDERNCSHSVRLKAHGLSITRAQRREYSSRISNRNPGRTPLVHSGQPLWSAIVSNHHTKPPLQ